MTNSGKTAKNRRKDHVATRGKTRERDLYLRRTYGITHDQYEFMFAQQEGACFICRRPPTNRRLHVDHDHKDGRVRGLLCWRCNRGIQKFRDDADNMLRASHYLSREYDGREL